MHSECDLDTRPLITTSHRRTEEDIVCQPQLLWGGEPTFSPSSVKNSLWYWFPQTLTHSCSCESHSPATHTPPMRLPTLNFLNFRSLHATPTPILHSAYPAHALFYPSLWSSKLPVLRSWKHLYIYSISTLLPPQQQVLCIFHLQGWMTYILSLAPMLP